MESEVSETQVAIRVQDLNAWYGDSQALHGVSFTVKNGELVSLLGRNGSGRTTIIKSILGMVPKRRGSILIYGSETVGLRTYKIVRLGKIGYCPEERGIFPNLSVLNNLNLPPILAQSIIPAAELRTMFPNLATREKSFGGQLSGGEQQMLAIARILRTGANLLLLDEISEGLAPVIVDRIAITINKLKKSGLTILLADQNFELARRVADRYYLVESGLVVASYDRVSLDRNIEAVQRRLSV